MSLEEHRCPSCGSNHITKTEEGLKCLSCGAILANPNDTKKTEVHIYRDEAKIENIRRKERKELREEKSSNRVGIGLLVFFILFGAAIFLWGPWLKVPVDSAADFRNKDKDLVISLLKDTGFWRVSAEPMNDLLPKDSNKDGTVENVTISGEDTWVKGLFRAKKEYNRLSPVKVRYHSMNPNAIIDAPEGNGKVYSGTDYTLVQKRLEDAGFSKVKLQPLHDLESSNDEKNGKTDYVTIAGEVEWSEGLLQSQRRKFKISDEVIIYYHSK